VEQVPARFAEGHAASGATAARAGDKKVYPGGKLKQRVRGVSGRYVEAHRGASGSRGGKSPLQERLGPLGHDGVALEAARLGNEYARDTIADNSAHLELSSCLQRERPGPLEGGLGFRPVVEANADPLEPRLRAVAHALWCDRQWALEVVQEILPLSPSRT
jgi:hypothetical protein